MNCLSRYVTTSDTYPYSAKSIKHNFHRYIYVCVCLAYIYFNKDKYDEASMVRFGTIRI